VQPACVASKPERAAARAVSQPIQRSQVAKTTCEVSRRYQTACQPPKSVSLRRQLAQ